MTFQGPGETDSKMTQNLTLSQRKVVLGVIFESLCLDPEKSFWSHRKYHYLGPGSVAQRRFTTFWASEPGSPVRGQPARQVATGEMCMSNLRSPTFPGNARSYPEGPNLEKFSEFEHEIEIFKRD